MSLRTYEETVMSEKIRTCEKKRGYVTDTVSMRCEYTYCHSAPLNCILNLVQVQQKIGIYSANG